MKRFPVLAAMMAMAFAFACSPKEPLDPVPTVVEVASVTLSSTTANMETGGSVTLRAKVNPTNAKDNKVTWESDNPAVATVDQEGRVTALTEGTATITAKAGGKTASCSVSVRMSKEMSIKTVLMKLYDALGGPEWKNKSGWGTDKPLNEWYGVSYNSGELWLSFDENNNLKGVIPDCIGDLDCLVIFAFRGSGITFVRT